MAIKMKGTLAVPGAYSYGEHTEVQTAEELKDAAQRNPIIPLTFGHTTDGLTPPASMQIGTVSQKWSEEQQKVIGDFWFYVEKLPEVIAQKIAAGQQIPISTGYMLDSVDADGVQHGIQYTHCAVLADEDPRCPLGVCGIEYRLNSERLYRYNQQTEITPPEPEDTPEDPVEATEEPAPDVEAVPEAPKSDPPAEETPEESVEQEPPAQVQVEPETPIPVEVASVAPKPYDEVDGKIVWVPDIFRVKKEE